MGSIEEHNKLVDDLLFAFGSLSYVRCWKRDVGLAYRGQQAIRYGVLGETDIDGIVAPSGRRLSIEVKSGRAHLSERQLRFRAMIQSFGGIYVLARSVESALYDFQVQL